jgi:ABC-type dipeptide/oligopeptide/nickel transport system permease component
VVQLGDYIIKLVHGDMGKSLTNRRPVRDMLGNGLRISFQLGGAALLLITIVGIPLGIVAAYKQNTLIDYLIVSLTALLPTTPTFVLAPLMMILFILKLKIIPYATGWKGLFDSRAILPLVILMIGPLLTVVRQTRAAVLEVLSQEYVRTARAKGLTERQVLMRHILKNALAPVVTNLGFIAASLLTGSLFVESIFGIPGFGTLMYESLRAYDYPAILGTTLVGTLIITAANLIVDISYSFLDPRVRLQ